MNNDSKNKWTVGPNDSPGGDDVFFSGGCYTIVSEGEDIAYLHDEDEAELIVKAVNTHKPLMKLISLFREAFHQLNQDDAHATLLELRKLEVRIDAVVDEIERLS